MTLPLSLFLLLAAALLGCSQEPAPGDGAPPAVVAEADSTPLQGAGARIVDEARTVAAPAGPMVSVAVGDYHACAAAGDGRVYCWGDDAVGQLGGGVEGPGLGAPPVAVPLALRAVEVTAGAVHTCARSDDGRVVCWGGNLQGQLRRPATPAEAPAEVPLPAPAVDVDAGSHFTCAVLEDGRAYCWGRNRHGVLGTGDTLSSPEPRAVAGLARLRTVSAGAEQACAADADGGLHCWGGDYDPTERTPYSAAPPAVPPRSVAVPGPARGVSAGDGSTCAIGSDGRAWCWGRNYGGQAGVGHAIDPVARPTPVTGDLRFRQIADGRVHRCGVTADGALYCWGMDPENDRLLGGAVAGDTCPGSRPVACAVRPQPVMPDERFRDVAASERFTCAVPETGGVVCWGDNEHRRLGRDVGSRSDAPVPVNLPDPGGVPTGAAAATRR